MKYSYILVLLACSSFSYANNALPDNRHIAITGTAKLEAIPDMVVVKLQVESLKTNSADAKKDVDDRVNNFLDGLKKFKVDEKNVSASNISTEPHYSYNKSDNEVLDGYSASRDLTVTLSDITLLNDFMDFALSVRIDQISNVQFKSSNASALENEVNALAVKDAKEKGRSFANAFDANLGKIYSINSASNQNNYRYGANDGFERITVTGSRIGRDSKPGKYLQENIVFSASVSVVFDLEVK